MYYYCARVFLPLLIASGDGVLVNTSSVSGFWPTAGAGRPVTAYSAANFAIKGFPEALVEALRCNAPQVRVVVVMPGVVNTDIAENSRRALGLPELEQLSDAQLLELLPEEARTILVAMGLLPEDFSADDLRRAIPRVKNEFQDKGFTAAQAATIILDGCDPEHGGSSSPRKPRCSTSTSAPILRRPSITRTTRRCTVPDSTGTSGSLRNTRAVPVTSRAASVITRVLPDPAGALITETRLPSVSTDSTAAD